MVEALTRDPGFAAHEAAKAATLRAMLSDTAEYIEGLPLRPELRPSAEAQVAAIRSILGEA